MSCDEGNNNSKLFIYFFGEMLMRFTSQVDRVKGALVVAWESFAVTVNANAVDGRGKLWITPCELVEISFG